MDTLAVLREECNRAIDFQMTWVDALDTKAGLILGAVLIVSGIIFSGDLISGCISGILLIVSLVVSCASSLACLYVRAYERPPNPDILRSEYYAKQLSTVQRDLIAEAAKAWLINQSVIQGKVKSLKVAMISLVGVFIMMIVNGLG